MTTARFYPIGTPLQPWTDADKATWLAQRKQLRSYRDEVLQKLDHIKEGAGEHFEIARYGALSIDAERFPLFAATSRNPQNGRPWVLITGGVHGYETSGVQGALQFLANDAASYLDRINLAVLPCVSPWAYEAINRWNAQAIDPNRSFVADSPCEEAAAAMAFVQRLGAEFLVHMDLHETTDSDEDEFRPAVAARDGKPFEPGEIPDGFYTVGDTNNPQPAFQAAIIAGVEKVTHIAPPDDNGEIIGAAVTQNGVINYACKELGLCAGMTGARYTTTTEVYPDSPKVTNDDCNRAQVAAVRAALDFALAQ
ncbi:MAG: M14 family metallocarboxypeptidase [Planctomycetota bacterium]